MNDDFDMHWAEPETVWQGAVVLGVLVALVGLVLTALWIVVIGC